MVVSSDLLSTYVYVIVSPVTYPFGAPSHRPSHLLGRSPAALSLEVRQGLVKTHSNFRQNFVLAILPEVG
jgi:hypothetical protein